jgi:flavin reductase (DIM6/NTAB) family NADH-FMN oxidoreductase RutF
MLGGSMKKSLGAKTVVCPMPVWAIGTYDGKGKSNVMTIAWGGICCSNPPCVQISIRKETYSYANIMKRKAFTVNVPSEKYAKEVDYFGLASGRLQDKFATTKLTAEKSDLVDAPYIKEFPLVLECKVIHTLEIGLHTLFVGEILDVKADEAILNSDDMPDIAKIKSYTFDFGARVYYGMGNNIGRAFDLGSSLNKSAAGS